MNVGMAWVAGLIRWRWFVLVVWAIAIALSVHAFSGLERITRDDEGATWSSSARAHALLKEKFKTNALSELALVFEGTVPNDYHSRVIHALDALPHVRQVHPVQLKRETALTIDRIGIDEGLDDPAAVGVARSMVAAIASVPTPDGVKTHLLGRPMLILELGDVNRVEVQRVERISVILAFVVLVLVFGSLAAASLPVAMGLAGITVTLGILVGLGGLIPVNPLTRLITSVIAIAVGIDYALFVVSRFREERALGRDVETAICRALSHAGGAITVSALVMAASVLTLVIPDFTGARAIAGCILLVLGVSLLTTFTLLPVLLVLTDRWIANEKARQRELMRLDGTWARLADWVLRHHLAVLTCTVGLLALLVIQVGHMRLWEPGPTLLPKFLSTRQGYDALARAGLGGQVDSLFVIVQQSPGPKILSSATLDTMSEVTNKLRADARVATVQSILDFAPAEPQSRRQFFGQLDGPLGRLVFLPRLKSALAVDSSGTYTVMRVIPREGLTSPSLRDLVLDIQRHDLAARPGVQLFLGGNAARRVDFMTALYAHIPLMIGLVVSSIYLILLVYFRSIVLPLKAIAMNSVPVLAACGVLVLTFQDGIGARLIGLDAPPGAVMSMTPMVLFCLVFGLSMDYEVLILSRIREAHLAGYSDDEAIRRGMTGTGGIITGAAAIMLSVFAPNLLSTMINAKELGLGLSMAVLLDATLIRLLLVPAFMKALGRWNWWFPGRTAQS